MNTPSLSFIEILGMEERYDLSRTKNSFMKADNHGGHTLHRVMFVNDKIRTAYETYRRSPI